MKKIRWGILSTAKIGVQQVIPALQQSELGTVLGIASRNREKATEAAQQLGIPKVYASYEELLEDPEIDAVYNPLPNHLHVPFTLKAMQAGKHVLCEKPIALSSEEAKTLQEASREYPDLKVMEAFMYRFHPQWDLVKKWIAEGIIGKVKSINSIFTYYNDDPNNIRNDPEMGGGGLMDIGCYCVSVPRYLFGAEPTQVRGVKEMHPDYGVDTLFSGVLHFEQGTATFTCSTRLQTHQNVKIWGASGMIEIPVPFNPSPEVPAKVFLTKEGTKEEMELPACNQFTLQGDAFAKAILQDLKVPTPLEDALGNMQVIDALFQHSSAI